MTGCQDNTVNDDRILVVVNRQNSQQPQQLYRDLRKRGVRYIHFVPGVEFDANGAPTADSLRAEEWGAFLNTVFTVWVHEDIQRIKVQVFEETLNQWCGRKGRAEQPEISLSAECQACDLVRFCGGGAPEHRDARGKSMLCKGYRAFFNYSAPYMRVMRDLIKQHRSPMELMALLRQSV
ncbi:TPA: radical SAM protein [Citrobacter freundii]